MSKKQHDPITPEAWAAKWEANYQMNPPAVDPDEDTQEFKPVSVSNQATYWDTLSDFVWGRFNRNGKRSGGQGL